MKRALLALLAALSMACAPSLTKLSDTANSSIVHILGVGVTEMATPFGVIEMEAPYVCTGFVVQPHKVLTAAHCAGHDMTADGQPVTLIKADKYDDLALLDAPTINKPSLTLRDRPVYQYEPIFSVGYGFGFIPSFVTAGHVVEVDVRPIDDRSSGIVSQSNGAPGMSGGPALDSRGNVVSINQNGKDGFQFGATVATIKAFLYDAGYPIPYVEPQEVN